MHFLSTLLQMYMILVIVRTVLSWFRPYPRSTIEVAIFQVTEPVLAQVRRVVPPLGGGLDLSPLIVIFVITWLRQLLRG